MSVKTSINDFSAFLAQIAIRIEFANFIFIPLSEAAPCSVHPDLTNDTQSDPAQR